MYIPHFRPGKKRRRPRDVDCFVLKRSDFPNGCWAPGAADWSASVTLRRVLRGSSEPGCGETVAEHKLLVLRMGQVLAIKHRDHAYPQQFELVPDSGGCVVSPRCPRCRQCMRGLWMPFYCDMLGCRQCQNIRYTSQTQNSNRYYVEMARLLEQRLLDHPELDDKLLPLLDEHDADAERVRNVQWLVKLGKGPLGRLLRQGNPGFDQALQRLRD